MPGSFCCLPLRPLASLRLLKRCKSCALKPCVPSGTPKYVAADAATGRAVPAPTSTCDCLVWLSGRVILSEGPAGAVVEESSRSSEMAA